jgi:hypothetical protein
VNAPTLPPPPLPPVTQIIRVCGLDTETHLIGAGNIMPRLVCATFDLAEEGQVTPTGSLLDTFKAWCVGNGDPELVLQLLELFQEAFERRLHVVIQNAAYDICVIMRYCMDVVEGTQVGDPSRAKELYLLLWDVLERAMEDEMAGGRAIIHDTIIREKLWHLSTTGNMEANNGRELRYGLSDLVKTYFGVDISDMKVELGANGRILDHNGVDITGTPQAGAAWRLRYSELDGVPLHLWPPEALAYAISDSSWARKIFEVQEGMRKPVGYGSMNSESLQVYADVALRLYSATGFGLDNARVRKVEAAIDAKLDGVRQLLRLNGVERADGTINTKIVAQRVEHAWKLKGRHPILTGGGAISASNEALEELDGLDPILDAYRERQEVVKIKTAFLPNIQHDRVWSNYDILKDTGRTSSYGAGDRSRRKPLYDAVNIQQIPRAAGVRECFLPPPGYLMLSCDYSALELCSVAQVTYSLLGYSVHREKNLQGYDLHSFLGSGMAMSLAPQLVSEATNHDEAYKHLRTNLKAARAFKDEDKSPEAEQARKLAEGAKHYRNFSKPVGLGYPGGLGPATLVTFAKATYGVIMDEDQARVFRELWHQTYPEMKEYFRWVERQTDYANKDSYGMDCYAYETDGFRRFRAGATYCATANGKAMQSLSADGAKRSVCWIARACFGGLREPNPFTLLDSCIPLAFIHDENLIGIPEDELATERSLLQSVLMVEAMKLSMPDVLIQAEPALMRRWSKAAGDPEWRDEPGRAERVYALLEAIRPGMADAVADAIGPNYNPNRRLVPWHDLHQEKE